MIHGFELTVAAGDDNSLARLRDANENNHPERQPQKKLDYSKYSMAGFDESHKQEMREKQFPLDLKEAFRMGAELSGRK